MVFSSSPLSKFLHYNEPSWGWGWGVLSHLEPAQEQGGGMGKGEVIS